MGYDKDVFLCQSEYKRLPTEREKRRAGNAPAESTALAALRLLGTMFQQRRANDANSD